MESPFKTPSKVPQFHLLPSSGSSSPFTPKRSLIKRKSNDENSVSRVLIFDDSNSHSPFNSKLEFVPLSQQASLSIARELNFSEEKTPVKTKLPNDEEKKTILLSPSIKNRPNRFSIAKQETNTIKPTPNKRIGSNNCTPSKKMKPNVMENCKPITHYFKPAQKRPDCVKSVQPIKHVSSENNMHFMLDSIKSEFSTDDTECSKLEESKKTTISQNFKSKNKKVNSPIKKSLKSPIKCNLPISNKNNMHYMLDSVKSEFSSDDTQNSNLEESNKTTPIKTTTSQKLKSKSTKVKSPINKIFKGPLNGTRAITPKKNGLISNDVLKSPRLIDYLENNFPITGGDTYSRFVKFLVLKPEPIFFGQSNFVTKIENCSNHELKIYGRLIPRKHDWIRFDGPDGLQKYKELDLCDNFDAVLMSLATKQLINTDLSSCELECLLNILKSPELKELQKTFKIDSRSSKSKTKPEMIKSFITFVKNQKTFNGNSVVNNLKERIRKKLGYCLKLSNESRDDIMSCLISESYPYFKGEEKERLHDCLTKFSLVEREELKFPKFEVKRVTVNFISKDSFEMYKDALSLRGEVQLFLEQKDHKNAVATLKIVFEKFKSAIDNKCIIDSFCTIPTYMRKYSAVSVYAYTLFKNITVIKKSTTDKDLAKEVLEFLLKHKKFSVSKQADLRIELAKVFESQYKQLDLAARIILDGLKDSTMSELDRQMLSKRAVIYANRKVRKLDSTLKNELMNVTVNTEYELPSTTINGKIISLGQNVPAGRKQVYSKMTENGDILYMSVEELALSHYKNLGFLNGLHDEGQLIKSMFLLCFWDIIYNSYPPHVLFIRQFQDCPLDWRTRHFYTIREKEIKDRMVELTQMSADKICDTLRTGCEEHFEIQSVINWKIMNVGNLSLCKTLLESIGIKVFLDIGHQILKDGRIYLHGMPDLIVWDVVNHKCKFVEVKGPSDKLSERQHSWLLKLIQFGADVEVCHVVGNGGKTNNCENID